MATLPSASVSLSDTAGAFAGGTGYAVVIGCVGTNYDVVPRVFSSAAALLSQHGYSPAVDYAALHIEATKKPVIFVGLPVATAATVGRQDASGWTGGSVVSIAAGSAGYLEEVDAILTCTTGGTIGVNGIKLTLSLDGGVTEKLINLGTAASYTVPYVGIVISFGAGTVVAGDEYTFATTAPMWDSSGLASARDALAAQLKLARSLVIIGDIANSTFAGYVTTEINGYETENDRFAYARVNVRDRLPLAEMSRVTVRMTGTPTLTFAEIGASADTITRSTGSFIADGFAIGDIITVAGSSLNNVTAKVAGVSALVLTLGDSLPADDLANEGPVSNCTIVGSHGLAFDAAGDTITRSGGSWLDDGFAVGDSVTVAGTVSNNYTKTITTLTATVMTFASGVADEVIGSRTPTIVKGETMSAWVSAMATAFASVDSQKRIDIGLGRLRKLSPITGYEFRRPVSWAASIREYQHDLHIPCWRKEDGPLDGWSMLDDDGNVVEFDERTVGGGLADRFTVARTYGNGPNGAFIALSMTRAAEGSLLSRTHNMSVANLACTVVQAETENAIGQSLVLKGDGTATEQSLGVLEAKVNSALSASLLVNKENEGQRASSAVWSASRTDDLSVLPATLTGVLDLVLNGTLEQIVTTVKVS